MNKKIKIVFIMLSLYNGGAEKSLVNLLNELPESKYDISLCLFRKEGLFLQQVPSHVRVLEPSDELKALYGQVNIRKLKYYPLYFVKLFGTLISKMATNTEAEAKIYRWKKYYAKHIPQISEEFDIVASYITMESMFFGADKIPNAKYHYAWVHNDYRNSKFYADGDRPYFVGMEKVISISDECVDILKDVFPDLKDKFLMIPNITSSTLIKKRSKEFVPSEFKENVVNLLSIGRLAEQKGFDIAIDTAKELKKRGIIFKWYIIGNGPLENALKNQIHKLDVSDVIELLGVRENPYPYLLNCDVVVQPSRWEGKSVVLDEAKILSKPIVVTNYDTVKDQILDGQEGIIAEMTPQDLADKLEQVITEQMKREMLTQYLSQNEYGNQNEIAKYMSLFEK